MVRGLGLLKRHETVAVGNVPVGALGTRYGGVLSSGDG